jgi:diguanylate cyclase (GGDEF)-like protein
MNKLYFDAEKHLKETYDVSLLDQIVLAREDRAIYYVEYSDKEIKYTKIHGNGPLDMISKENAFTLHQLESLFDMDSKYGEVAGKEFYKSKNINSIKNMTEESNVTIPVLMNGKRYWVRLHSYATLIEDNRVKLASCFITDVTKYLVAEELLYEKTHKDELTRLFNRYALYYHFELWGSQTPITSFYFDIDDFKHYNDTYGHKLGDKVLTSFSNYLLKLKSDDFVCYRLGGDEFYCLLLNSSPEKTKKYIDSIQESMQKATIKLEKKQLSVSIGVVTSNDPINKKYVPFMKLGDKMMYQSKAKGKNATTFATFELFKD